MADLTLKFKNDQSITIGYCKHDNYKIIVNDGRYETDVQITNQGLNALIDALMKLENDGEDFNV